MHNCSSVKVPNHVVSFVFINKKFIVLRHTVLTDNFLCISAQNHQHNMFSAMLNKWLSFLNTQTSVFISRPLQIGGNTHLYLNGMNETEIKIMVRWNYAAYKSYIRPMVWICSKWQVYIANWNHFKLYIGCGIITGLRNMLNRTRLSTWDLHSIRQFGGRLRVWFDPSCTQPFESSQNILWRACKSLWNYSS